MKRLLFYKITGAFFSLFFLGFLILCGVAPYGIREQLISEQAEMLYREADLISSHYADIFYNDTLSKTSIRKQLEIIGNPLSAGIWIVDQKGNILLDSQNRYDKEPTCIEGFDPTSLQNKFYKTDNFWGMFPKEELAVMASITKNYSIRGYVIIHTSFDTINLKSNQMALWSYLSYIIILFFALLFLGFILFHVYFPIQKMANYTEEYVSGNFEHKLPEKRSDEIGIMGASINYIADDLNNLEDRQRKFISNISHDFRSPLTSMKGYLEAFLDGTIPVEMYEKYLKIILFETERLHKLTQSLLTLNDFSRKDSLLDISEFDINDIIRKTAASFGGICMQKHINIELILTGDELFVSADLGKIQQVLYNLIDNAIKFSDTKSAVTVETTEKTGKVYVSVKDSGIGIPSEAVTKIWERFYKTDLSRGKDKRGSGLGLTIVKEIIQAHNENINVISTEGVGTTFIFSLKMPESSEEQLL